MTIHSFFHPAALQQHSLDMRQFIDFQEATLTNGMRIIQAHNSSGLCFTILPDRGLDMWSASYKGLPLTWLSPGSPHPPDFGRPWLAQFNGGLLTTCGLTHTGPPETDRLTGKFRDLHGDYTRLRAQMIGQRGGWNDESYMLELTGVVTQSALFGEQLQLRRVYRLRLGEPVIEIADTVANMGDTPAPLMILYHFNVGYPLVREGSVLHTASRVAPRDDEARKGYERWQQYDAALPAFAEQVYFHHVNADAEGFSTVALLNDDLGLALTWDTRTLPYLTQWKNTRRGIYVCGIEPGNCLPEGQNAARENGRLPVLQPGETRHFRAQLHVFDDLNDISRYKAKVNELQTSGKPVKDCRLDEFYRGALR